MEKRLLVERWLRQYAQPIPIYDEASVSSARQLVRECGQRVNFAKDLVESVALMASELTHNQLGHARQGYFAVKSIERPQARGLEVIAADIGPGIEQPENAIRGDGPTNTAGLGAGLGAVSRLADEVEIDDRIGEGLCVLARKFESRPVHRECEIAIMGKPFPEEAISGDDAVFLQSEGGFIAAVCDGLGHGPEARKASHQAVEAVLRRSEMHLDQLLFAVNEELTETRGCAMSVVRFKKNDQIVESVSVGDVQAHLYSLREARFLASTPFILGARQVDQRRIRIEQAPVEKGTVLVMFTDGLKSRTTLKGQLDVLRRPAIAMAQHLLENNARPDDDALVLVARLSGL